MKRIFDIDKYNRYKVLYNEAVNYLNNINPNLDLNKYLKVEKKFKSKNDILYGLLVSLQNRQMSSNVIGLEKEERKNIFKKLLFDYDSNKILEHYNCDSLLNTFANHFNVKNIDSKNNLWRLYAKSVISSCEFINRFSDVNDFDKFVSMFDYNELSSAALPMLLEGEIVGLGFPLACDFLKELGYDKYPKPDVHIKDIFAFFNLCENNDYSAYKAVIEMANIVNETPYKVDKIFWLIGSGSFYLDNINIGRKKETFINTIKDKDYN